ncbi:MAG: hypothetical protein BWK79_04545 [Beggiatoa sp. IS2]|nr:MAG: hypothetical protein BWK79_04545 [Beggiatoa sp. IS2]
MKTSNNLFLPNFCDVRILFLGVILAELLAFVLALVPLSKANYEWEYLNKTFLTDFAMVSLFVQWVMLVNATLLCLLRHWLSQLNHDIFVGIISYLLILLVTAITSELAWRLDEAILWTEPIFTFSDLHQPRLLQNLAMSAFISGIILGYAHWQQLARQSTLACIFFMVIAVTWILSEIAAFLLTDLTLRPQAQQHQLFLLRNCGISAMISAIALRYFYVQFYWQQETIANASARIQALQARIRPHFLFNSMNTIASLIRFQPAKAEQAVEDFAELFRASLAEVHELVTLQEELDLCTHYLRIETLRLGERLQVVWHIDNVPKNARVLPLSLQPLLENAIYHGIQLLPEGGTILITGLFDGQFIQLNIENPLADTAFGYRGQQLAYENIRQRLQVYYGKRAKLTAHIQNQHYYVSLYFPYLSLNLKQ